VTRGTILEAAAPDSVAAVSERIVFTKSLDTAVATGSVSTVGGMVFTSTTGANFDLATVRSEMREKE
jgi:hypothetical protein